MGLDLHLDLTRGRPGRSLEEALRAAITDGRLAPDTRLPAARSLAADLGISRNTVADVYAQLAAEGWLTARVGAGTWVAHRGTAASGARPAPVRKRPWVGLRAGIPSTTVFGRREWTTAVRQAVLDASAADLGYPDPAGTPQLRAALAAYLARTRGVVARQDSIVVGHGYAELLGLVCRALRNRGAERVAVEQYGHDSHRRVIAAAGLTVVPVPVDEDGAEVRLLERLGVSAVVLTPAHQFPVGVPLAPDRHRWLASWAGRTGALVIEDDYDGEFRYDRRTIGALQSLAPDRVAYVGTASKATVPAIGLAWGVLPGWLLPDVLEQRDLSGARPSALNELALARYLTDHHYDRSVRRLRATYRMRRARLAQVTAEELPGCEVTGLSAGLQCLLTLPPHVPEDAVLREALDRGLRLEGLGSFSCEGAPGDLPPALAIGYAEPAPAQYDRALQLLVESIRSASPAGAALARPRTR
nr:PLP-dependent aminotransferase family protein [Nocardioides thalensis]